MINAITGWFTRHQRALGAVFLALVVALGPLTLLLSAFPRTGFGCQDGSLGAPAATLPPATVDGLAEEVRAFVEFNQCLAGGTFRVSRSVIWVSIMLGVVATALGAFERAKQAAVASAVAVALAAFQQSVPSEAETWFYNQVAAEARVILTDLRYGPRDQATLDAGRQALNRLRLRAAAQRPAAGTLPASPTPTPTPHSE